MVGNQSIARSADVHTSHERPILTVIISRVGTWDGQVRFERVLDRFAGTKAWSRRSMVIVRIPENAPVDGIS